MKKKIFSFVLLLCLVIPCAFMFSGCQALKGLFNKNKGEYSITYVTNGGTKVDKAYYNAGDRIALPETTKYGYELISWNTQDGESYYFDTMPAKNLKLYAEWRALRFNITLVSDKVKLVNDYMVHDYDTEVTLPTEGGFTISSLGKTFLGWYDNPQFKGDRIYKVEAKEYGDKTYYAKWEDTVYTITYEDNNGFFDFESYFQKSDYSYTYGEQKVLPTISYPGYKFMGWIDKKTGKEVTTIESSAREDKVYVTKFERKSFRITYCINADFEYFDESLDPEGTGYYTDPEIKHMGDQLLGPEFVSSNTTKIKGWYKSRGFTNKANFICGDYDKEEVILYAIWIPELPNT